MGMKSNKVLMVKMFYVELASDQAELPYDVHGQAKEVDLAPKMRGYILLITVKFAK